MHFFAPRPGQGGSAEEKKAIFPILVCLFLPLWVLGGPFPQFLPLFGARIPSTSFPSLFGRDPSALSLSDDLLLESAIRVCNESVRSDSS